MNTLTISGKIENGIIHSTRTSGVTDCIPIQAPDSPHVSIMGSLHSYNENGHTHLYIKPTKHISSADNSITLIGYICKSPIYRTTPLGKQITNLCIAVPRENRTCDYIPCICWGSEARKAAPLTIGTKVKIEGRIQSREYKNTHTTVEVCSNHLTVE